jgi:uncharacterized protein (TIGR03067 family)
MKHAIIAIFLLGGIVFAADDADSKKLLQNLEGSYKITAVEKGGEAPPKEFLEKLDKVSVKGNKFSISFKEGGKAEEKSAAISVDATKKPATIDLKADDGDRREMVGIVEIDGNTVKICWADDPKAARPTKFETNKENKQFMITLMRTKD